MSTMEMIEQMASSLWDVWSEMWNMLMEVLPRAFYFILWILSAIFILPCVFVAGVLYPKWLDWSENL